MDRDPESLSKLDRRALLLLETGAVAGVVDLIYKKDTGKDGPDPGSVNHIPKRVRSGEMLLRKLGLIPDGCDAIPEKRFGLILIRRGGARRVTLVFSGNQPLFSLPLPLLTDVNSHVVLIRDPARCFGLLGIPELGKDYETCVANLRRLIEALAVKDVFCIGVSAGGSTAIKMGCDLQARGILGFSVPTTLDLNDEKDAELKHYPQLTKLYAGGRHFGIDLAQYYRTCSKRPGIMLVYSAGHVRDAWLAQRMSGIRGVRLVKAEDFVGHATYRWARSKGVLGTMIKQMFALNVIIVPDKTVVSSRPANDDEILLDISVDRSTRSRRRVNTAIR